MDEALAEARAALGHGDIPVGAVVVHNGAVVGRGHNRREIRRDPTARARIFALRQAAETLGPWRLLSCALYLTIQPSAMCCPAAQPVPPPLGAYRAPQPK